MENKFTLTTIHVLMAMSLLLACGFARGQGKACEGLKNEEITNRCLAIRDKDPKRCNMIPKDDIKFFCLAVVLNNQHQCNYIQDADSRKECFKSVR